MWYSFSVQVVLWCDSTIDLDIATQLYQGFRSNDMFGPICVLDKL
jgi:hypothetical protein